MADERVIQLLEEIHDLQKQHFLSCCWVRLHCCGWRVGQHAVSRCPPRCSGVMNWIVLSRTRCYSPMTHNS